MRVLSRYLSLVIVAAGWLGLTPELRAEYIAVLASTGESTAAESHADGQVASASSPLDSAWWAYATRDRWSDPTLRQHPSPFAEHSSSQTSPPSSGQSAAGFFVALAGDSVVVPDPALHWLSRVRERPAPFMSNRSLFRPPRG